MFWPDVIALKEFYNSPLGRITSRHVGRAIRSFWPAIKGDPTLGIGFATPYIASYLSDNSSVFACMPAGQGVIHWPPQASNLSLLADEGDLPFPDNSLRYILVAHALENSENTKRMMAEIWRVLSPSGRLLVIVPNRRGIWARSPQSPFAHGQPFTNWQLRQLFAKHSFTPTSASTALFFPPSNRTYILRAAGVLEEIGKRFFSRFGGVILMEAEKHVYAASALKSRDYSRVNYIRLAQPI